MTKHVPEELDSKIEKDGIFELVDIDKDFGAKT
jgi:hypothetical protein